MNLCKNCGTPCPFDDGREECADYKPMTEQQYIQTCTTEELAEWIKGHMNCNFCPMRLKCEDMRTCMEHIKSWLKQPHTKEE